MGDVSVHAVIVLIAVALGMATLCLMIPSMTLCCAALLWIGLRRRGLGESLGWREALQLDSVFIGGLLAVLGAYALLCRGVAPTGFLTTAALSGLFLHACHRASGALPGRFAWLLVVAVCAAVLWRFSHPVGASILSAHFISNV